MTTDQIKEIIRQNQNDIAFIVGNGVNRYPNNPNALSWDDLLIQLWKKVLPESHLSSIPVGISLTEFYDVLELENTQDINLQKEVADLMRAWKPLNHHTQIIRRMKELDAPVLTTNFEETLARTFEYQQYRTEKEGFTDFYPWSTYHGTKPLNLPTDGFGIWYINGMINYHRSIRLGLSHYIIAIPPPASFTTFGLVPWQIHTNKSPQQ